MYQAEQWLKTHQVRHIHTTESKQLPCMVMCPVKIYIVGMEYYLECCREKVGEREKKREGEWMEEEIV